MQSNHHILTAISRLSDASRNLEHAAQALQLANPIEMPAAKNGANRSPAERLSGKQLGAIRVACRRADISPEQLAEMVAKISESATDVVELSRPEASALLTALDERTGYQR